MGFVKLEDGKAVVAIQGSLNLKIVRELQKELTELINTGERTIVFDMKNTNYIDSTGLGLFVDIKDKLGDKGRIVAINLHDYCKKVFETTRMDQDFCPKGGKVL